MAATQDPQLQQSDASIKSIDRKYLCDMSPVPLKYNARAEDMNDYVMNYFQSLNSMASRIISVEREVMAANKDNWENLSFEEQEQLFDDKLIDKRVRLHYSKDDSYFKSQPEWFPRHVTVHSLTDDSSETQRDSITSVSDLHLRDQFSAPFSWATRSQLHIPFPDSPDTARRKQAEQTSVEDGKPRNPQLDRLKEQSQGSLISSSRSTLGSATSSKSEQGSQASLLSEKPSESTSKSKEELSVNSGNGAKEPTMNLTENPMMEFLHNW